MKLTPRLNKAIKQAAIAHAKQIRKGSKTPYISHPYAVMCIASEVTSDEDILIACLLHDVLEDVPERYGKEAIRADFGDKVVRIIEGVSKDDSLSNWKDRADAYLTHLRIAGEDSLTVSAADKIHNLMSILEDRLEIGEAIWDRFNSSKDQQFWWYQEIQKVLEERIPNSALTARLGVLNMELIAS